MQPEKLIAMTTSRQLLAITLGILALPGMIRGTMFTTASGQMGNINLQTGAYNLTGAAPFPLAGLVYNTWTDETVWVQAGGTEMGVYNGAFHSTGNANHTVDRLGFAVWCWACGHLLTPYSLDPALNFYVGSTLEGATGLVDTGGFVSLSNGIRGPYMTLSSSPAADSLLYAIRGSTAVLIGDTGIPGVTALFEAGGGHLYNAGPNRDMNDGLLYAVATINGADSIYLLNEMTGSATFVADIAGLNDPIVGLTSPEPGTFLLIGIGLLLFSRHRQF